MMTGTATTACINCPLADCPGLRDSGAERRREIQTFKQGEIALQRGGQVLTQGTKSTEIYTVLSGVLIRFRLMEDGQRQIINFLFPGDLIGLQSMLDEPMTHGVEALTPARLCVFPRDRFLNFVGRNPQLGYDIIWLAAKEESALEEHLVALGQRNARERIAYLALFLLKRAEGTCLAGSDHRVELSVTQGQVADMLGLSLVHTNRSMQSLRRDGLVRWSLNAIEIPDPEEVSRIVRYDPSLFAPRPFL
jgi:CRP/FNR family transcriptional regulator, anaerobic regulatory protein